MKQLIVFTRTEAQDYTYVCLPEISDEVFREINGLVQTTIDVDHYVMNLNSPRWLFWRNQNIWIWGVGCYKSLLCPNGNDSLKIRGFYGIISDEPFPQDALPDLDYFSRAVFPEGGSVYKPLDVERVIEIPLPIYPDTHISQKPLNPSCTINLRKELIQVNACDFEDFIRQVRDCSSKKYMTMVYGLEQYVLESANRPFMNAFGPMLKNATIHIKNLGEKTKSKKNVSPYSCRGILELIVRKFIKY